jgi:hypothetical protein
MHFLKRISKLIAELGSPGSPAETKSLSAETHTAIVEKILETVAPYTMVHETGVRFAADQVVHLIRDDVPGVIVECGVWRGGCAMAMLLAQVHAFGRVVRPVYLLDSFEGLPPVTERDGPLAEAWQAGAQPEKFFDNCAASVEEVRGNLRRLDLAPGDYQIIEGWFSTTLPPLAQALAESRIALLRLDCDWYDSTKVCLDHLEPLVNESGTVIVDDYYAWDGCARAVHDYLSKHDLPYRIKSLDYCFGAYFIKKQARTSFEEF